MSAVAAPLPRCSGAIPTAAMPVIGTLLPPKNWPMRIRPRPPMMVEPDRISRKFRGPISFWYRLAFSRGKLKLSDRMSIKRDNSALLRGTLTVVVGIGGGGGFRCPGHRLRAGWRCRFDSDQSHRAGE